MTSLISYSTSQHAALKLVEQNEILFHTNDHPGDTVGWNRTGDGSGKLQSWLVAALDALYLDEVIEIQPPRGLMDRVNHTRRVALTADGHDLLREWGLVT